ncbi:hypothetical protein LTR84_010930 [Exophiala bonariae]|uniref:Fungal N-terminal domain-containing protein n=1 Tax=Exophiala bonariae TaxID=1690606 RepID=A0AAV9NK68_9EURO|nr:hypothetical protein LTR84_010930 [Exophiala bonariae]
MSPSQVKSSARVVVKSTLAMATLFRSRVQEDDDLRTISPLAAYVAFVTGSSLVLYSEARAHRQTPEGIEMVPGVDSEEMVAIRRVLWSGKMYWRAVARLSDKLDAAIATYHALGSTMETSHRASPSSEDERSRGPNLHRAYTSLLRTSYVPEHTQREDREMEHDDTTAMLEAPPTTTHSVSVGEGLDSSTTAGHDTYDRGFQTDLDGLPVDSWLTDGFWLNSNAIDLSLDGDSYRNDFNGRDTFWL